jgi:hypothetical protein
MRHDDDLIPLSTAARQIGTDREVLQRRALQLGVLLRLPNTKRRFGIRRGVVTAFRQAYKNWGVLAPRTPEKAAKFLKELELRET